MSKKGLDYSMNKYVRLFLHRGLIFAGLGPIVTSIVYIILEASGTEIVLTGLDVFKAIVTTYVIAFVHAGSSVFPQIEKWPLFKQIFFQGISIYLVYTIGYLINSWIPLNPVLIGIYSGCFFGIFGITWLIIYICTGAVTKKMNKKLEEMNR